MGLEARSCTWLWSREELIDPDRIGVVMAQNRGVSRNVFTNEAHAIAWLGRQRPAG